jgi:hypothetical protein
MSRPLWQRTTIPNQSLDYYSPKLEEIGLLGKRAPVGRAVTQMLARLAHDLYDGGASGRVVTRWE